MKNIDLVFVGILVFNAWAASALTIVRQDGQSGARTTIAGAIAVEPDGGTIQIQQFSGPFSEATLNPALEPWPWGRSGRVLLQVGRQRSDAGRDHRFLKIR